MVKFTAPVAAEMRSQITAAIQVGIQEALKRPLHVKVNSSNIMHTVLEPEGDQFTITFQVVVYDKKQEEAKTE